MRTHTLCNHLLATVLGLLPGPRAQAARRDVPAMSVWRPAVPEREWVMVSAPPPHSPSMTAEIRFDDGAAYERYMGIWSRLDGPMR